MDYRAVAAQVKTEADHAARYGLGQPTHIYALLDPDTGEPRYVGQSIRPLQRLDNHMNEPPSNCHRSHWIQALKRRGVRPGIVILETVCGEWPWQESERYWIAKLRAAGARLVNNTSGGDGVRDLSPESRARMSATWRGRKHRPESIERMRSAQIGRKASDETRRKHSVSMKGRVISWIGKISLANRKLTDAQVAEILTRLAGGERTGELAKEFGVHRTTLSKVKMGQYCPNGPERGE